MTDVLTVDKDRFPTQQVYGPTAGAELRLITCGGTFDRASGHYLRNVVVSGVLVEPEPDRLRGAVAGFGDYAGAAVRAATGRRRPDYDPTGMTPP